MTVHIFAPRFRWWSLINWNMRAWLNHRLYVSESDLKLKIGWLKKHERIIPIKKITNVTYRQSLIDQIFKMMTIEIETAGSELSEIVLDGYPVEVGDILKQLLASNEG